MNQNAPYLDTRIRTALSLGKSESIQWVSPVASDGYAEYYDQSFLEQLDASCEAVPLSEFWPASGPRWDGLARTSSGKLLLIEAKAYIEEAVDYRSKAAKESSRAKIALALESARKAFAASPAANWNEPFFQYANRLAHLYFMRDLNKLDAYVVFVYFVNAPDVPSPSSEDEWRGAIRVVHKSLGIGSRNPFAPYIGHVYADVPAMLSGATR